MNTLLLTSDIRSESDVIFLRKRSKQIAALLHFDPVAQKRISSAVSAIAHNALVHAVDGRADFSIEGPAPERLVIRIRDSGAGITNLSDILAGTSNSANGESLGILGARQSMDTFRADTIPGEGTTIELGKTLPPEALGIAPGLGTNTADMPAGQTAPGPNTEASERYIDFIRRAATAPDVWVDEGTPPRRRRSPPRAADGRSSVLAPGKVLEGTYRVVECLGGGGMGSVYVVEHVKLGRRFAAKVVAPHYKEHAESVERLKNEARTTSALRHPNIVDVTHLGDTEDGSVFIVMELLEGEDLRTRIVRQSDLATTEGAEPWLGYEEVRTIVHQILAGLSAAHAAGVVHRDLKPDNVFLARDGEGETVKLVDFGLAKMNRQHLALTQAGQIVGTPVYMAPEQAIGANVDPRTDVYAVGCMVYELLTGRIPYEGSTVLACALKHATEPVPHAELIRPDIPASLLAVVQRAMAKNPDERFANAREMAAAWDAAWTTTPETHELTKPASIPAPPPARQRRGWMKVALGALVVVLATGITYVVMARSDAPAGVPAPSSAVAPTP